MASPFPGMDPYLEDDKLWPGFQHHLVHALHQLLLPGLMDRYRARISQRHYVSEQALFTSVLREEHPEALIEIRQRSDGRLVTLLEANINGHLQEALGPDVTALPVRPDRIEPGVQNRLSLHLYHVTEDPYYKNAAGEGNDVPNIAKAPMSLCLFYILTAHHNDGQTAVDALRQQEMMGMALKTLHDNPVITDRTTIPQSNGPGIQILPANLRNRGNSIQVILRPVSPEDAVGFWATEDQQLTTLSAYYEVRVIFLEPERPRTVPGIVLSLGAFDRILAFIIFSAVVFLALTAATLFRTPTPVDRWWYPLAPVVFIAGCGLLALMLLLHALGPSLLGAAVVLAGLPVRWLLVRKTNLTPAAAAESP